MNAESMPIIRLEIENMKQTIITALGLRGSELGEAVQVGIERAVKAYDFDAKVSQIVSDIITMDIDSFFRHGPGRAAIQSVVQNTLEDVFPKKQTPERQERSAENRKEDG